MDDVPEPSTEKITQVVRSYLELAGHDRAAGRRSADEVAALFADDAIFESSPGGEVHRGVDAIRSAYHAIWDDREQGIDLVSLTVVGGEATVRLQVVLPGRRVDATDVMIFDEDAKITSLRTYLDLPEPEEASTASTPTISVGLIGSGQVAQTIAGAAIEAGHRAIFSNSRGPDTLKDLVSRLGDQASAGTTAEAAQADIVVLAVRWAQVPDAVSAVADWDGRIVIDATNQSLTGADVVELGDQTGSERNAALMPGARVVKAFNTVSASVVAESLHRSDGPLVIFVSGDDTDAKTAVSTFIESLGLAPVDLGDARDGRLMQWHRPLNSLHLVKIA